MNRYYHYCDERDREQAAWRKAARQVLQRGDITNSEIESCLIGLRSDTAAESIVELLKQRRPVAVSNTQRLQRKAKGNK